MGFAILGIFIFLAVLYYGGKTIWTILKTISPYILGLILIFGRIGKYFYLKIKAFYFRKKEEKVAQMSARQSIDFE